MKKYAQTGVPLMMGSDYERPSSVGVATKFGALSPFRWQID
jgi:hypothetical protein